MKASIVEVDGISYLKLESIETGIEIVSTELYNKLLNDIKDAEQKILEYEHNYNSLSNELALEQKKVSDTNIQSAKIQLELKNIESLLTEEQIKVSTLESSIEVKNKEICKLKQEYKELSNQAKCLEIKNIQLENQLTKCLSNNSDIFQRSMAIFLIMRQHENLTEQYLSIPAIQHYYNQYVNLEIQPYQK